MFTQEDIDKVEEELGVELPSALEAILTGPLAVVRHSSGLEFFEDAQELIDINARIVVSD